jgi:penicillin-binding protein 1B
MALQDYRYVTWRQAPFRRFYYTATSRVVLAPALILALIGIGVLFYYYSRYSAIIDASLHGNIFVRTSGIYAAPLTLRDGSGMKMSDLIAHLRKIGLQSSPSVENDKRGRYVARANVLEIYPGSDSVIDGERAFPNLRVVFGRAGEGIQSITDLDNRQQVRQAQVEPELISSVVNQEREKRKIIEYKDLPQHLIDAIISIEDRQFFEHSGINWRGVLRALFRDYQSGELREGGSSITQQLVKNLYLKPDRTPKRKLSEAYMSIILEQRLKKDEIMAMYCNQIYLGQRGGFSINGFGEAARAYFGKDVAHITLSESALLAGIIRSPNYYSPFSHKDRAIERRNLVLDKMVEAGKITEDQASDAKRPRIEELVKGAVGMDASDAPYFVDYLTRQLESQYDERGGNLRSLRIYSTIDLDLQHAAYQAVTNHMPEVQRLLTQRRKNLDGLQCALVAMNAKTGEILAMVGGRDYAKSQLNRATDARRQPGSVFKPFVYAAAIALGSDETDSPITTATTFVDEPKTFGGTYSPGNFGDKYELRPMTVRDALVHSKNVITVEIASRIGFAQVVRMAERAGLTKVPAVPSVALGVAEATPLQMASAYTSFANQGRRVLPIAIKRVTTKDGGTIMESRTETREVMTPQVAYILTDIMRDVLDRGTGTRVRQMGFTATAAGKTGSSRDAWFAGYTPNLVCVVWVGYDDNSDIGLTGGAVAAPIWANFMARALRVRPELSGEFEDPGDLVIYDVDPSTGEFSQDGSSGTRRELFLRGTEPGSGQALPDHSIPDSEPPQSADSDSQPQTSRPPNDERMRADTGGIDSGMIPLPPEAQKVRPRPGATPTPIPKRSFTARLKEFFGFGSPASAKSTPQPSTPRPTTEPTIRPTPRATATPRPIPFETTSITETVLPPRTTTKPAPSPSPRTLSLPKPRPARAPQVATRPRTVTDRKNKGNVSGDRTAKSDKDKKDKPAKEKIVAAKKDDKKSETGPAAKKQPEQKKPVSQLVKVSKPATTPTPAATPTPVPIPVPPAPQGPKGEGTFSLEVCSVSGLLPINSVCKNTIRKRFKVGSEPTKFCSAARHGGN